jgi:hypothetical protein
MKRLATGMGDHPALCALVFVLGMGLGPLLNLIDHPTGARAAVVGAAVIVAVLLGLTFSGFNNSRR